MAVKARLLEKIVKADRTCYAILAYFAFIVVTCIVVYNLPSNVQEALKARTDVFNPLAAYTSIFVHADLGHLLNNLVTFVAFGSLVFVAAHSSSNDEKLLLSLILVTLLVPLTSYLYDFSRSLPEGGAPPSCGLSGVASGVVELFIPFSGAYLKRLLQVNGKFIPLFTFSITSSAIFAIAYAHGFTLPGVLGLAVGFSSLIYLLIYSRSRSRSIVQILDLRRWSAKIILIGLFAFFIQLYFLFPQQTIIATPKGNISIGIAAHCIGLLCGGIMGCVVIAKWSKPFHDQFHP